MARWASRLPLGRLTPGETLALLAGAAVVWLVHSRPLPCLGRTRRRGRGVDRWLAVALVLGGLWCGWPQPVRSGPVPGGCLLADSRAQVLVLTGSPPSLRRLLRTLADAEVRRLDLVVVGDGGMRLREGALEVAEAVPVDAVVSPDGSVPGSDQAVGVIQVGGFGLDLGHPVCPPPPGPAG